MAISRVQFKHTYVGTTAVFASNVTAGNLIVVACSDADGTATDASCNDSLGNTYTKIDQALGGGTNLAIFYAYNIGGGACTVTASCGGYGDKGLTAVEYTSSNGAFSIDPLDAHQMVSPISGATSPLTAQITTSVQGLLFCAWANEIDSSITGWTANLTQINLDSGHYDGQAEGLDKTAGTYTEGVTKAVNSGGNEVVGLAGFKEPSGGGGSPAPTPQPRRRIFRRG